MNYLIYFSLNHFIFLKNYINYRRVQVKGHFQQVSIINFELYGI